MVKDVSDVVVAEWASVFPDLALDAYSALLRTIRCGRLAEVVLDEVAGAKGISASGDYEVLAAIRRRDPDPSQPQELAERVMVTTSGMTGRLDRLEGNGLIERQPHPADRRATHVRITPAGQQLADQAFQALVRMADVILSDQVAINELNERLRELAIALGDLPLEGD